MFVKQFLNIHVILKKSKTLKGTENYCSLEIKCFGEAEQEDKLSCRNTIPCEHQAWIMNVGICMSEQQMYWSNDHAI